MYATIEADIENGVIQDPEASRLPSHAHVLITLLSVSPDATGTDPDQDVVGSRVPHPELKHTIDVCGDLLNTVPMSGWNLPQ